ncbi:MAG: hypothetical protein LBF83_00150, partial [Spirochaetaceae bacterium]|nr:hypothetical protein [Spirochaetaceae bacterium]
MINKQAKIIILSGIGALSILTCVFLARNISFNIQSSLKIENNALNNRTQNVLLNDNNFENNKNKGFEYKQKALEESNQLQRIYYWNEAINSWKNAIVLNQNDTVV